MIKLDFKQGLQEVITSIERLNEHPRLVAIYGWPDSGKSYLMERLAEYFEARGITTAKNGGAPTRSSFEMIRDMPSYIKNLILFHCGWERRNDQLWYKKDYCHEDPNILAEEILGRKLDLNIGIYNPRIYRQVCGEYDLVIKNSEARQKPKLF